MLSSHHPGFAEASSADQIFRTPTEATGPSAASCRIKREHAMPSTQLTSTGVDSAACDFEPRRIRPKSLSHGNAHDQRNGANDMAL
jgi:hypothetical protein